MMLPVGLSADPFIKSEFIVLLDIASSYKKEEIDFQTRFRRWLFFRGNSLYFYRRMPGFVT